jgi:hypothetical protein
LRYGLEKNNAEMARQEHAQEIVAIGTTPVGTAQITAGAAIRAAPAEEAQEELQICPAANPHH